MYAVKGSLLKHLSWWRTNVHNEYIVNTVAQGYRLPLLEVPSDTEIRNNKSARDQSVFVSAELKNLLSSGVVLKVDKKPVTVNALSVATNDKGKHRLVLDLRHINPLLHVPKFRYEDIKVAGTYFSVDGWMSTFDLRSGYHHIDIHQAYQKYLGFKWEGSYYVYTSCPFGLSVSGLIFSKVLRELVKRWRAQGIAIVLYLDDGFITSDSPENTSKAVEIVRQDLTDAGFVINVEKTNWTPSQVVTWLGFQFHSHENEFVVPPEKLRKTKAQISRVLHFQKSISARDVAKVVGKLCSLYHAFGNMVYLLTKHCSMWISDRENWNEWGELSPSAVGELNFWIRNLGTVIRMPLVPIEHSQTLIVYSDASADGCGAYVEGNAGFNMFHQWNDVEREASSTWREIKAIVLFLGIHSQKFAGKKIKWYTDNLGITSVIRKGSMKADLNNCALEIFGFCLRHDIQISLDWVPRALNTRADDMSKWEDRDDWGVHPRIFQFIEKIKGPFTLDVFASNLTHQTLKFYSKWWCEGSAGVDAFAYNWQHEVCWLVPPPTIVADTLKHMRNCKTKGVLVVPRWHSAVYWPLLHNGSGWVPGIELVTEYRKPKDFFIRCQFGNDLFTEKPFQGNIVVLFINFAV
jgi:hypothetical protein